MSWTGSINSGAIWIRMPRNAGDGCSSRRSLKRSALELQRCRGSALSGGALLARPSCPPVLTRRASVRSAQPSCTVAGSAPFSTPAAGLNAPGPLRRGSRKRTRGMNAHFSPPGPRLNVRLLPRNRSTRAWLLKTSSKSSCQAVLFYPSVRVRSFRALPPQPRVPGYPKIFWRAASEMATTAGFLIFLSTEIA